MIQFDSYLLASYWALIILADVDKEIHALELEVINRFVNESHTSSYFDNDEELGKIMTFSRQERKLIYDDCINYIALYANSSFKHRFYNFIGELVSADGIVKNSEMELYVKTKDVFNFSTNIFVFSAPKEIDQAVQNALKESFPTNQQITFSPDSFSAVELKFVSSEGTLVHRIVYDNSKTNYTTAPDALKEQMDKIRYLSKAISLDMLKSGVLGNKKSLLNFRFNFKNDNVNYFVITDLYPNKVFLSYVGCSDWDYHIN